jgi:hypothetical protein
MGGGWGWEDLGTSVSSQGGGGTGYMVAMLLAPCFPCGGHGRAAGRTGEVDMGAERASGTCILSERGGGGEGGARYAVAKLPAPCFPCGGHGRAAGRMGEVDVGAEGASGACILSERGGGGGGGGAGCAFCVSVVDFLGPFGHRSVTSRLGEDGRVPDGGDGAVVRVRGGGGGGGAERRRTRVCACPGRFFWRVRCC